MSINKAKKELKESGYYTNNLWHIRDVIDKFNCSDKIAQQILNDVLQSDYCIETINELITDKIKEYENR